MFALDLANYELGTGILNIGTNRDGGARQYTTSDGARRSIIRWLGKRGLDPGALFNPINKGGRIVIRRLSEQAIYIAVRKRSVEAGIPLISPEALRRTSVET